MPKEKIKKYGLFLGFLTLILCLWFYYKSHKTTILEFGMFAGSNWDVPNGNTYAIIDGAIKRFEKENPGVKIHYHSGVLKEDYSEWFSRNLLLGTEPDVFMILASDFNTYASIGVMKNLDKLIQEDKSFKKDAYYSTTLNEGKYHGSQYALPYETVPVLMFVNKTLLQSEGIDVPENDWTWDEFYSICERVTKDTNQDGVLDQFGYYDFTWKNAIYTNNGRLFNTSGANTYMNTQNAIEAIKFLKKLEQLNQNHKVTAKEFDSGNVAFRPFPFSSYRTYQSYPLKVKKYSSFQWDCITMPAGPKGDNKSELSTLQMGISARTTKEKLAWKFIKCLTYDVRTQMDIFRYSQGASVLKTVTESDEVDRELRKDIAGDVRIIDNELLSEIIENAVITPKFPKYDAAVALADTKVLQIIEEDKNPDTSLMALQREIKKFLKN